MQNDKAKEVMEAFNVDKCYVDEKNGEVYLSEKKKGLTPVFYTDFEVSKLKKQNKNVK